MMKCFRHLQEREIDMIFMLAGIHILQKKTDIHLQTQPGPTA